VARIDAQSPQADKIARADVVIDTDGLLRETEEQVFAAWTLLGRGEAPSL
jgi:dephospho-CoA kinase